jgi:hypothetical protein
MKSSTLFDVFIRLVVCHWLRKWRLFIMQKRICGQLQFNHKYCNLRAFMSSIFGQTNLWALVHDKNLGNFNEIQFGKAVQNTGRSNT